MVNHFIKTRFNLNMKSLEGKMSNKHLDLDWLNYRLDLFLKYCAPSVLGQDRGDFYWLIHMDKETNKEIRSKIENLDKRIFIHTHKKQEEEIINSLHKQEKRFLFSRLDSDDAYRKDFSLQVFKIHKEEESDFFIDIEYKVLRISDLSFYERDLSEKGSHFVTLSTNNKNANVYGCNHIDIPKINKYKKIQDSLALEIIHDSNLRNSFFTKKHEKFKQKKTNEKINFLDYNISIEQNNNG
jgi:hypothetical protein